MIYFYAHTVSGHYRMPGMAATMAVVRSFQIAPPSTVIGFMEALATKPVGTFKASDSTFAYGWVQRPRGRGEILRRDHAWASGGAPGNMKDPKLRKQLVDSGEMQRPTKRETLFDMVYQFAVDGPFEDLIRKGLTGDVDSHGVLSLGESEDAIGWLAEGSKEAEWLVPGSSLILTTVAPKGYGVLNPTYQGFQFSPRSVAVPEKAWLR